MNGLPYYKRYPRDFLEGTIGMPFELKGAYSVLLDLIYVQAGALPDDPHYISGHLGCSVRKWKKLRSDLIEMGKIQAENGIISNFRADKEQIILRTYQDKQRENRTSANKNNDLEKPRSNQKITIQNQNQNHNKDMVILFEDFWQAYPHRNGKKQKRKPSLQKFEAAVRRGVDPQQIIDGAKRFRQDRKALSNFAPDPSTWLNQEGWTDEIDTGPPGQPQNERDAKILRWKKIAQGGN